GRWPAFSWASRAALSPVSWAEFSFGVKVPPAPPGRWPEFSADSRAALSPDSWVAFSFDLNAPAAGLAVAAAATPLLVVLFAAADSGPARVAPMMPPVTSEPTTPAIVRALWVGLKCFTSFSTGMAVHGNSRPRCIYSGADNLSEPLPGDERGLNSRSP